MKAKLDVVKKWEMLFNQNSMDIINTYSDNGILIGTFAIAIKKGRKTIKPYFEGLFKKENLRVKFDNDVFVNELDEAYIVSGFYEFSYDEDGENKKANARYSYVVQNINGQMLIVNHHSSEIPEK
jgi:hypothetical protein